MVLSQSSISITRAKSPRNAAQGTTILRLTSQPKLAHTVLRLPAVEAFSAVLVAVDKAMLWQYMVAVMATPTAKTETAMALRLLSQ